MIFYYFFSYASSFLLGYLFGSKRIQLRRRILRLMNSSFNLPFTPSLNCPYKFSVWQAVTTIIYRIVTCLRMVKNRFTFKVSNFTYKKKQIRIFLFLLIQYTKQWFTITFHPIEKTQYIRSFQIPNQAKCWKVRHIGLYDFPQGDYWDQCCSLSRLMKFHSFKGNALQCSIW